MNKKLAIAAILVATVAVAGVGAIFLLDEPPGSRASTAPGGRGERRPTPDRGFDDLPAGAAAEGADALTPEQEKALRAALERMAAEGATRASLQAGVDRPWPLAVAQEEFDRCVGRVGGTLGVNPKASEEQVCSCATRVMQVVYPEKRPPGDRRNFRRAYERAYGEAVENCTPR